MSFKFWEANVKVFTILQNFTNMMRVGEDEDTKLFFPANKENEFPSEKMFHFKFSFKEEC
jgi:hypothetical protein